MAMRVRDDGTRTFTDEAWDLKWYWPAGTRVLVCGLAGTVTKAHSVTVDVTLDDGRQLRRVPMAQLQRR